MLGLRSNRLVAGDLAGYLAPLSKPARAVEEPIVRSSRAVPLTEQKLVLDLNGFPAGTDAFSGLKVDLTYRYRGLETDNVFRIPFVYSVKRTVNNWKVTSSALAQNASLPLWATGAVKTSMTKHFLALYRPGLERVDETLDIAEQARERLGKKLMIPLEEKQLMLLARDRTDYLGTTTQLSPVSAIAQAETSYEVTERTIKVQSRQIVINLEQLYSNSLPSETLQHELGHLALARVTRPFTPSWVSESAAMFLADTKPLNLWRTGTRNHRFASISFVDLNRLAALGQHDVTGDSASFEYAYAAAAAWYLTETFGVPRYFEFYDSYAKVPAKSLFDKLPHSGGTAANDQAIVDLAVATTARLLRASYGFEENELDKRVRTWISQQG